MEKQDKVTREDLRAMEMGDCKTFHLNDAFALDSAAVTAVQVGRQENCRYRCSRNYADNTITITKESL